MAVDRSQSSREPPRHAAEQVRGQVRHPHPRQDQEARVVGEEADVLPPRLRRPADEPVAAAQVPRRRRPGQAGERPAPRVHQVLQVLAHRLRVAQVVVLLASGC